ncbi:hypothetical protein BZL30_5564 [Mycobacterium kansasii]|uniref:Uncharacterized protein n=1 Tax=Mycobacterium kansasii TaxID=1768 RepID=A0A1V3WZG9_MYCKA|nr:hypothetical protein BZL30_5564 [Mycobacterium kansasii]
MTTEVSLDTTALDKALDDLHAGAPDWVALALNGKVTLLEALPRKILNFARRWWPRPTGRRVSPRPPAGSPKTG